MSPPRISHFRGGKTSSTRLCRRKQRVLLARALYGEPNVFILDEGTAHLDPQTEAVVSATLARLGIAKVIVAHRPDAVRGAERTALVVAGGIAGLADLGSMHNLRTS